MWALVSYTEYLKLNIYIVSEKAHKLFFYIIPYPKPGICGILCILSKSHFFSCQKTYKCCKEKTIKDINFIFSVDVHCDLLCALGLCIRLALNTETLSKDSSKKYGKLFEISKIEPSDLDKIK